MAMRIKIIIMLSKTPYPHEYVWWNVCLTPIIIALYRYLLIFQCWCFSSNYTERIANFLTMITQFLIENFVSVTVK